MPAISKSELVIFPVGLSNDTTFCRMSSGHSTHQITGERVRVPLQATRRQLLAWRHRSIQCIPGHAQATSSLQCQAPPQDFHEGTEVHQCVPQWRVCSDANVTVTSTMERRVNDGAHQSFTRRGIPIQACRSLPLSCSNCLREIVSLRVTPVDFVCCNFCHLVRGQFNASPSCSIENPA
jgi:hypothetical protein